MATNTAPIIPPVETLPESWTDDQTEAVQDVLTRTIDVLAGYDKMLSEAEAEVAPILRKLRDLHNRHSSELANMLTGSGVTPEMGGSLMGTVNKAVVSLRALFDDIDDDALEAAIDGESHVIDAFDEALAELNEGEQRQRLHDMRTELTSVLDEARRIAD